VDYVRSCYKGEWRLFNGRPDLTTKGRLVFAPDNTPHYPGFHNVWSNNWTMDTWYPVELPELGDITPRRRSYSPGTLRIPYPPAITVGRPACIAEGETYPPAVGSWLIEGYDAQCWIQAGIPTPVDPGEDMPTGGLIPYAGAVAPPGYLACNGQAVSRVTYAALFSVLGTVYGPGDGVTTFNVPDLQGRLPLGAGAGVGLTPRVLGGQGGIETYVETLFSMVSHAHYIKYNTLNIAVVAGAQRVVTDILQILGAITGQSETTGFGPIATPIMNPFTVFLWCIKT
jgi:microcystin-dependent protein